MELSGRIPTKTPTNPAICRRHSGDPGMRKPRLYGGQRRDAAVAEHRLGRGEPGQGSRHLCKARHFPDPCRLARPPAPVLCAVRRRDRHKFLPVIRGLDPSRKDDFTRLRDPFDQRACDLPRPPWTRGDPRRRFQLEPGLQAIRQATCGDEWNARKPRPFLRLPRLAR